MRKVSVGLIVILLFNFLPVNAIAETATPVPTPQVTAMPTTSATSTDNTQTPANSSSTEGTPSPVRTPTPSPTPVLTLTPVPMPTPVPTFDPKASAQSYYDIGNIAYLQNNYQEAIMYYDFAIQAKSSYIEAYYKKGMIYHNALKNYEEAYNCFKEVAKFNPDFDNVSYNLGLTELKLKKYEDALLSFERSITRYPDNPEAYNGKGLALYGLKRLDEAISSFSMVMKKKWDHLNAYLNKGIAQLDKGNLAGALACYKAVLRLDKNSFEGNFGSGYVLSLQKKYTEALPFLDTAITLNTNSAPAFNNRGFVLEQLGKKDEALKMYAKALELEKNEPKYYLNKAELLFSIGKKVEALPLYEQCQTFDDKNFWVIVHKAQALIEAGRYQEAITDFDLSLAIYEKNLPAIYGKAQAYSMLNDKENAINNLKTAIEMDESYKGKAASDSLFANMTKLEEFKALTTISIKIDGKDIILDPKATVYKENSVIAPVNTMFQKLKISASYNPKTLTVTATKGKTTALIKLNTTKATVNGKSVTLVTAPKIVQGRTIVPVDFIGSAFGVTTTWDKSKLTVFMNTVSKPVEDGTDTDRDDDRNTPPDLVPLMSTELVSQGSVFTELSPETYETQYPQMAVNCELLSETISTTSYDMTLDEAVKKQVGDYQTIYSSGKWIKATEAQIKQYLDPNNYVEGDYIYQFLDLSASVGITVEQMNAFLKGRGILEGKGKVFIDAAKKYNVSEVYLAAHACLETGNGDSKLAMGIVVEGVKVYNMYGIGAYDSDPIGKGSKYAHSKGWTTPEKAIDGGAKWISESYINNAKNKQNTLYKMKWNPENPGTHEYATDVGWAVKQTSNIKKMYANFPNATLKFELPMYKQTLK